MSRFFFQLSCSSLLLSPDHVSTIGWIELKFLSDCALYEVTTWMFLPISGQPRTHLLQCGWSVFVSAKRLVAGVAFIFLKVYYTRLGH
jgi:hypothetical protein